MKQRFIEQAFIMHYQILFADSFYILLSSQHKFVVCG